MKLTIARIGGDGIGPEITREASRVLDAVAARFGHEIEYRDLLMGGCSIDRFGVPLTQEAIDTARSADAVLMGSIGGDPGTSPWYRLPPEQRPEAGLLGIRKALRLYANLRPAWLFPELAESCPLASKGGRARSFDLLIIRELTGGLYFGARKTEEKDGVLTATDTAVYSEEEIRRIVRLAFETARGRRRKLTSVDKANVLDTSRLWRKVTSELAAEYPDVSLENMLVDNCAMQLVRDPEQFDVIVTGNMFGDILSDEASMITGSIGMLPSASLGGTGFGLYEPSHGSAPDIAGKDLANPIAAILSAAMLLRHSFSLEEEASAVEAAVKSALAGGLRTGDLMPGAGGNTDGLIQVGCTEMGRQIAERIGHQ